MCLFIFINFIYLLPVRIYFSFVDFAIFCFLYFYLFCNAFLGFVFVFVLYILLGLPNTDRCFSCGMPGHWSRHCPLTYHSGMLSRVRPRASASPSIGYNNFHTRNVPWQVPTSHRPSILPPLQPPLHTDIAANNFGPPSTPSNYPRPATSSSSTQSSIWY